MNVGNIYNMPAKLIIKERQVLNEESFVEIVVWELPLPVTGSNHVLKYRLAFVVKGVCVVRYDNEAGKGDHRHVNGKEATYRFTTAEKLLANFWNDVDQWRA